MSWSWSRSRQDTPGDVRHDGTLDAIQVDAAASRSYNGTWRAPCRRTLHRRLSAYGPSAFSDSDLSAAVSA